MKMAMIGRALAFLVASALVHAALVAPLPFAKREKKAPAPVEGPPKATDLGKLTGGDAAPAGLTAGKSPSWVKENGPKTAPEPPKAAAQPPKTVAQPPRTVADPPKTAAPRRRPPVVRSRFSPSEYSSYLRKMNIGQVSDQKAPTLRHRFFDESEALAVFKHYDIKLLAFSLTSARQVVEVRHSESLGVQEADFQKIDNFAWPSYSRRIVSRGEPLFQGWLAEIRQHRLLAEPNTAMIWSVMPKEVEMYFRFKQLEAIKRSGVEPGSVVETNGAFLRVDRVGWIFAIDELVLKDGAVKKIEDFELRDVRG